MFGSAFRRGGGGPPSGGIGSGYSTPQTPDYEKIGPTRILPHLYIGCAKDALSSETREKHGITYIVNVSGNIDQPDDVDDDHFLRCSVNDGYIDKLQPFFAEAHKFIDKVQLERSKVLVHCQAGVSRSAALTISYIMNTRRITCEQAYRFVKVMRPVVSPNFNFLGQLLEYEKELKLCTSPSSSGAGTKRKHMNLSLSGLGQRPSEGTSSKRLNVPTKSDNNNSITSLSPASALAGLTFENSIQSMAQSERCPLPGPTTMVGSTVVPLRHHHTSVRACELPPPKRCHSWNGLADLASPGLVRTQSGNATTISPKLRKPMGNLRPRSLNLSMSHLAVPEAVLELNAKVDSELSRHSVRGGYRANSADNILDVVEESEGGMSSSTSAGSLSVTDLSNTITMSTSELPTMIGTISHDTPDSSLTPHSATFTLSSSSTNTPVDIRDHDVAASPQVSSRKSMTLSLTPSIGSDNDASSSKMPAPPDKLLLVSEKNIAHSSISKPTHEETKTTPIINKELSSSNPSLPVHSDIKDKQRSKMRNIATIGQLSFSQPLLRHFCSSLEQLRNLGSGHTKPSDLSSIVILGGRGRRDDMSLPLSPHRRSHSLGNIVSPTSDDEDMVTSPSIRSDSRTLCDHTTPKPLHDSLEMIQVT